MKRNEILANRKTVIEFLKRPELKKATDQLDKGNGERCCLGHMCYVLGLREEPTGKGSFTYNNELLSAPQELIDKVGFFHKTGRIETSSGYDPIFSRVNPGASFSLANINDMSDTTPQEIGAYLETVIEGGVNTPWRSLNDYEI